MIEPGLARIGLLLRNTHLTWPAIHVAGTNGKGSICTYVSAMLQAAGLRCGRFCSPHIFNRWDCITVDEQVVSTSLFLKIEREIAQRDSLQSIRASEFEILTATAFEIFNQEKVDIAVVEVGMGGRLDATNIFKKPLVTVIAKIGLDHQSFLGNTIQEIAKEKAGIMKPNVPCVIDGTNQAEVLEVLTTSAKAHSAHSLLITSEQRSARIWDHLPQHDFEPHQQANLSCAVAAVDLALTQLRSPVDVLALLPAIQNVSITGRLQLLSVESQTGRAEPILLDGAHNPQSAKVLASYVDRRLRRTSSDSPPVTWLIAMSKGKDVKDILSLLLRPSDRVVATEFTPVDGMPWVTPMPAEEIINAIDETVNVPEKHIVSCDNFGDAIVRAVEISSSGPLVVAGSLYLLKDVLTWLKLAGKREK